MGRKQYGGRAGGCHNDACKANNPHAGTHDPELAMEACGKRPHRKKSGKVTWGSKYKKPGSKNHQD